VHAELREQYSSVRSLPIQRIAGLGTLPPDAAAFEDNEHLGRFRAANPGVVELLESADTVYVNGEGSLHGLSSMAVALLYLMHIAKTRLGRPVHLINHSCYPDDRAEAADGPATALYKAVYERLDRVAVREAVSTRLVRRIGITAIQTFDCLPLFVERHLPLRVPAERRRRVLLAGSASFGGQDVIGELAAYVERMRTDGYATGVLVGARAYLAADDVAFVEALRSRCGAALEVVTAVSELDWLRAIAESAVLVSGRFHHTIAAACLDTPFIVLESNTPKIQGLLEMLRCEAFVSVHERTLAAVLDARTRDALADPQAVRISEDVKAELRALARRNFR
jgi:polysaccharide pyruvyl transferase WcaK-like protein